MTMERAPQDLINELQRLAATVQVQKIHIQENDKQYTQLRTAFTDLLDRHNELRERSGMDYDRTQTDYDWLEKAGILD
jgi:hypothetical protein